MDTYREAELMVSSACFTPFITYSFFVDAALSY